MIKLFNLILFSVVMFFCVSCYAAPSSQQENGEFRWVQMQDGSYRRVFIPSDNGQNMKVRNKNLNNKNQGKQVQNDDSKKRTTKEEWQEWQRKERRRKANSK